MGGFSSFVKNVVGGPIKLGADVAGDIVGDITGTKAAAEAQKAAAGEAARAQTSAAEKAIQLQREQAAQQQQLLSPYTQAGRSALDQQLAFLGLAPTRPQVDLSGINIPGAVAEPRRPKGKYGIRGGLNDVIGNITQAFTREAVPQLAGPTQIGQASPVAPQMTQQDVINQILQGPEYQSLVQQGEEAILQNAAATGGLRGGNVQAALAEYRPQVLSQLLNQRYNRLAGITNIGQASAAGQATAGQQTASNIGQLYGQIGQAQAGSALAPGPEQAQAQLIQQLIGSGIGAYARTF